MNKKIYCAGLPSNQKHTKLVSILQLECSTTYQKAANFHLLQKTISRYTSYVLCLTQSHPHLSPRGSERFVNFKGQDNEIQNSERKQVL